VSQAFSNQTPANADPDQQQQAQQPTEGYPEQQHGPDADSDIGPNAGANHQPDPTRSGIATDARSTQPGSYGVTRLYEDIAAMNATVEFLAKRNPHMGYGEAQAAVDSVSALPAWDSQVWHPDARRHLLHHALMCGRTQMWLSTFGVKVGSIDHSNSVVANYFKE
jgi:hypothetical protein